MSAGTAPSGRRALLVAAGFVGCLIAAMSVVDMLVTKPYDGVVPDPHPGGGIAVRDLVPGGAAEKAGLKPGDVILGIGGRMLRSPADAPAELLRHEIGEAVRYLVDRQGNVFEAALTLAPYRAASLSYFYYATLGAAFFVLGAFVAARRPNDPAVTVFYVLCILFMLFFVCRLRPLSYYWIDYLVQVAGTLALFLLPAVFLHFFLLFPTRKVFRFADARPGEAAPPRLLAALQEFLNGSPLFFTVLYTLPPVFYVLQMAVLARRGTPIRLVYGAPRANWILLADYLVLGVLALTHSFLTAPDRAQRRPILALLLGTVGGTVPFVVFVVSFPSFLNSERYLAWGVVPMALVPLTFAYTIVRHRLFAVQVVVRKSIVYAFLTAVVTGLYALALVMGNRLVASNVLFASPLFAFTFSLVVVLLIDPLRRRLQAIVDRLLFRDRADFQQALLEVSRSVVSQLERGKLHALLTGKTAEILRLSRLDLLTPRSEDGALALAAAAGASPSGLASPTLPLGANLARILAERDAPVRLSELDPWSLDDASRRFREEQLSRGVKALVPVATRGRLLGVLAVGAKRSEEELTREDLDNLTTMANQGALGLEAAALHEELTRRAEVERDLEIARDIQESLFPRELPKIPGIELYGISRPAKVVGGDFYDFLPVDPEDGGRLAIVVGDVSGKSIPASLLMVAAKEIVYARAMADPDPSTVFGESNRRIYAIKRRMFVSLSYFLVEPRALSIRYALGGQPTPLLVRAGETSAVEIPAPETRLPLGAFRETVYDSKTLFLRRGDLLLFYTDGLTEAMSTDLSAYGEERLRASLVRHAAHPLPVLAEELLEDIRQFTYGAEQYDDQTFVLLRVSGAKPTASPNV